MPTNDESFDRIIQAVTDHPVVRRLVKTLEDGVKAVSDEITNTVRSSGTTESSTTNSESKSAQDVDEKNTSEKKTTSYWCYTKVEELKDGEKILTIYPERSPSPLSVAKLKTAVASGEYQRAYNAAADLVDEVHADEF